MASCRVGLSSGLTPTEPLVEVGVPLAVSVVLEIGREAVPGEARDAMLAEAEALLMQDALS